MIGRLTGLVAGIAEHAALIDVAGVAYVVQAGARTLARLDPGERVTVYVETQVREDAIKLFGFLSEEERAWFAQLQDIPGVGARTALAVLDACPPRELADAIALQDKAAVGRAHGVGPKLAQRIVAELKDKPRPKGFLLKRMSLAQTLDDAEPVALKAEDAADAARTDAVSALVNLGFGESDAVRAVAAAARANPNVKPGDLVRAALKELGR